MIFILDNFIYICYGGYRRATSRFLLGMQPARMTTLMQLPHICFHTVLVLINVPILKLELELKSNNLPGLVFLTYLFVFATHCPRHFNFVFDRTISMVYVSFEEKVSFEEVLFHLIFASQLLSLADAISMIYISFEEMLFHRIFAFALKLLPLPLKEAILLIYVCLVEMLFHLIMALHFLLLAPMNRPCWATEGFVYIQNE